MNEEIIESSVVVADAPVLLGDETLIQLADQAEKRIEAMNKIKRISLKLTNSHDWVDEGGRPYLQASGAEKIGRMFGISWRISEPELEHLDGGHYMYSYKGYFTLAGATIEAIGTRSSRDGFFRKYKYEEGKEKQELPPSEIDRGDVKKSAYTNVIGNGITRILGIRNLSYDDLQEFAGITKETIGRVGYKSKGKADGGIPSDGAQTVVTLVLDIRKKEDVSKAGKRYALFTVKTPNADYTTFSESFAKIAKEAKEAGRKVAITFVTDKYGNKAEGIVFSDDGPGASAETMEGDGSNV